MAKVAWVSPSIPWANCGPEQKRLLMEVWAAGDLSWKLTPNQQGVYFRIKKWQNRKKGSWRKYGIDISRRYGKSMLMCTLAFEDCYQNKGWRVPYIMPIQDDIEEVIRPLVDILLQDCPPALRPKYVKSEQRYQFHTGSYIPMIGLDKNPNGARGTGADRVYMDEAAFFANLGYIVDSVLKPQLLGRPWADIFAASTPPETPSHYWSEEYIPGCINNDAHDIRVLEDADQYTDEEIENFYNDMPGGRDGVQARREYRAEHIADANLMIVPEFREAEEHVVKDHDPPTWRDCYVAMDPGWADLSAILYGYWDFYEHKLIIEDEDAAPRLNSAEVAATIKRTEKKLWGGLVRRGSKSNTYDATKKQPFLRVSDVDNRLLADLAKDDTLPFIATQKDNLSQQVNAVRVAFQRHEILIHPRCKKLIKHLKTGIWKKNQVGKEFAQGGKDMGHFDLIAALVYMYRNIHKLRNPEPLAQKYVAGDLPVKSAPTHAAGSRWSRQGRRFYVVTGK